MSIISREQYTVVSLNVKRATDITSGHTIKFARDGGAVNGGNVMSKSYVPVLGTLEVEENEFGDAVRITECLLTMSVNELAGKVTLAVRPRNSMRPADITSVVAMVGDDCFLSFTPAQGQMFGDR